MKVLFVASVFRHLKAFHTPFIHLLQEKGCEVWAAANGDFAARRMLEENGVKCVEITFSRNPLSKSNIVAYQQTKDLLRNEQFDLVHVHTPVAAFLTRIAFRNIKKGRMIYTAHGFHFFKGAPKRNWILFFIAERIVRKWTDAIIVMNSEDYKNASKLGFEKKKIFFTHGVGVDISSYNQSQKTVDEIKSALGIDKNSVVISCIAELNENKNHQFLLRNWKAICTECPDATLLLIGKGSKEQELREFSEKKLSNVKFLGYRKDVPDILKVTDIVTLLSKREGLPRSIMEAMSAEIPCIVTNTRGLRDLVVDGESGYVIEHDDDLHLRQSFISLIKDKSKRIRMGKCGFELVQPYDIKNVLKEYEAIYEKYLDKKK